MCVANSQCTVGITLVYSLAYCSGLRLRANGSFFSLPVIHIYLMPQAYVLLVYLAITTKKPKFIAFASCLGGLLLLIACNVLVRTVLNTHSTFMRFCKRCCGTAGPR